MHVERQVCEAVEATREWTEGRAARLVLAAMRNTCIDGTGASSHAQRNMYIDGTGSQGMYSFKEEHCSLPGT